MWHSGFVFIETQLITYPSFDAQRRLNISENIFNNERECGYCHIILYLLIHLLQDLSFRNAGC